MKVLYFSAVALALSSIAVSAQNTQPLDTIGMTPGYDLDEVVVQAEKPVMQTDGAKLTYNVDEDPAASSSSAMDILKKVPQVTVDADGNVLLNGSSAFKFQLNGLDNPMLKQYAKQIFEGMPAQVIAKIEVITEPGAKEDAEGTAGIINIITERTGSGGSATGSGASGTASLRVDNRSLTPSVYALVKKNNFTLSLNGYYQWAYAPNKGEQYSEATYLQPGSEGTMKTLMGQRMRHQLAGGSLNMSWEPNADNLFTAGADIFYLNGNINSLYGTTSMLNPAGGLLWSFGQDGSGKLKMLNLLANASYRHNFGYDGNHLVLSYLFNYGNMEMLLSRSTVDMTNYTPAYTEERDHTKPINRGHTVQADYANDFHSDHHLMEVGVKGIFRHNTANSAYEYGNSPSSLVAFPDLDTYIIQPQNIYAAYASYTGSFDRFGIVAGLRYEHTYMGVTDRANSAQDFRNRLNDWVPNAALTWNFSPASNLRLSYQMRISRPSIEQVNPFELSFTPYEVRKGNPDLTSERSHIVSLKYSAFGRVFGGTVGLEYNRTDNAISGFTYLDSRNGVNTIVTSYANIGKTQEGALTGFFNWSIIRGMNFAINGRLSYYSLKAPAEGYANHGWGGTIGGNWNYMVADVYKFSAYGSWTARRLNVQGYDSGFYYYGLSASRDFLADKSLTLGISANNFFQSKMTFKGHKATHDVIYSTEGRNLSAWSVGISLSWKFGSLKAQVKKTGVEVTNDDINKSSNSSQGGGATGGAL